MERRIERGIDALFSAAEWCFEQSVGLVVMLAAFVLILPALALGSVCKA